VTALLNFQRTRPRVLDRIAKTMKGTDPGITAPGEDKFAGQSRIRVSDVVEQGFEKLTAKSNNALKILVRSD
jgi:hypothetical protein